MPKTLFKDRTSGALILSALLILAAAAFKRAPASLEDHTEIENRRFWIIKAHSPRKFDVMIMGDSRIYRGISPAAMGTELPQLRILNFGFSSGGLNREIYSLAEERLDKKSNLKIIVLGITPYSLTPLTEDNRHYWTERKRPWEEVLQFQYIDPFLEIFQPTSPLEILRGLGGTKVRPKQGYYHTFYDDGWIASTKIPEDPREEIPPYREIYAKNRVSPRLIDDLIRQTQVWSKNGILVFGLLFPTSKEMEDLEKERSGLDAGALADRFRSAGGIWLTFEGDRYHSYDGSHLDRDSAVRFSIALARQIRAHLGKR